MKNLLEQEIPESNIVLLNNIPILFPREVA